MNTEQLSNKYALHGQQNLLTFLASVGKLDYSAFKATGVISLQIYSRN